MKAILDTNFLMLPHQFGVDIFELLKYYELATMSACVGELKKLGRKKTRDGKAALIALKLIKENNIETIKSGENCDKAVLNYAIRENCAVATNDKELIKALKNKGIKVIRLRQKQYLIEE